MPTPARLGLSPSISEATDYSKRYMLYNCDGVTTASELISMASSARPDTPSLSQHTCRSQFVVMIGFVPKRSQYLGKPAGNRD